MLAAVCTVGLAHAQEGFQWAPIAGRPNLGTTAVYGTQGVAAPANQPGVRGSAAAWTDAEGNLWIFGGQNYDGRPSDAFSPNHVLSDLWKYDTATGQWAWIKGPQDIGVGPTPGTLGVPDPANNPRSRKLSTTWVDAAGNLWLFGGNTSSSLGVNMNDLWRFEPATGNWTWMKGSATSGEQPGVYGVQGVADPANNPGSRQGAMGWTDNNGILWLFGGRVGTTIENDLNDLWKYDPNSGNWTWVKGSSSINGSAVFGTQGVADPANTPGSRFEGSTATDSMGRFWLYGGESTNGGSQLNDVWMFDPATENWTWAGGFQIGSARPSYGVRGMEDADNFPGARRAAASWMDASNNLWIFGGLGELPEGYGEGTFSDLWRYNTATDLWTWIAGVASVDPMTQDRPGTSGLQGEFSGNFSPGSRVRASAFGSGTDTFWMFGGYGSDSGIGYGGQNDLWQFDVASGQWAWVDNTAQILQNNVYGEIGVAAPGNTPSARETASTWTDPSGDLWLFGGIALNGSAGYDYLGDLWRFDHQTWQWAWENGPQERGTDPVYGTLGTAAPENHPGARRGAASWTDSHGLLWLFGGQGSIDFTFERGYRADLWNYNPSTGQWTWVKGPDTRDEAGVYGTMGTPDAANNPGARLNASTWVGPNDTLWMFGGDGYDSADQRSTLNDLWRYDPATNEWTWMRGSDLRNQSGAGTVGQPGAPENTPRSRNLAGSWTDEQGRFWLFGGTWALWMRDLWYFDPAEGNWTWVSGSTSEVSGAYGTLGVPDPANYPGSRNAMACWSTPGKLWMFGGSAWDDFFTSGRINDFWSYDIASGQWTWVGGSNEVFAIGNCGPLRESSPDYLPGARSRPMAWTSPTGEFWLMGGPGYDCGGYLTDQGDLWRYGLPIVENSVPPQNWLIYR